VEGDVENWQTITPPVNIVSTDVSTMKFLTLDHYVTLINANQAGLQVVVAPGWVEISLFSLKRTRED
jgi:hypothetical protein